MKSRIPGREPAMSRAHAAYAQGLRQSDATISPNAQRSFLLALEGFTPCSSTVSIVGRSPTRLDRMEPGKFAATLERLARIEPEARSHGYNTLLGRNAWQRGQVFTRQWRLTEGLAAFRESASSTKPRPNANMP